MVQALVDLARESIDEEKRLQSVRVLGRNFKVIYGSAEQGMTDLGLAHFDAGFINIRNGQTEIGERNALLHEVLHLLDFSTQLELTEKQITVLANGLIGVFEDNPEFTKFITKLK